MSLKCFCIVMHTQSTQPADTEPPQDGVVSQRMIVVVVVVLKRARKLTTKSHKTSLLSRFCFITHAGPERVHKATINDLC